MRRLPGLRQVCRKITGETHPRNGTEKGRYRKGYRPSFKWAEKLLRWAEGSGLFYRHPDFAGVVRRMYIALGIDFDIQLPGGVIAGSGEEFAANALPQLLNGVGHGAAAGKDRPGARGNGAQGEACGCDAIGRANGADAVGERSALRRLRPTDAQQSLRGSHMGKEGGKGAVPGSAFPEIGDGAQILFLLGAVGFCLL